MLQTSWSKPSNPRACRYHQFPWTNISCSRSSPPSMRDLKPYLSNFFTVIITAKSLSSFSSGNLPRRFCMDHLLFPINLWLHKGFLCVTGGFPVRPNGINPRCIAKVWRKCFIRGHFQHLAKGSCDYQRMHHELKGQSWNPPKNYHTFALFGGIHCGKLT